MSDTTEDRSDQSRQQGKTFKEHKINGERAIYDEIADRYSEQEAAFANGRMAAVKAAAQHAYTTFKVFEHWTGAKPEKIDTTRAVDFTSQYFPAVYMLVIARCLSAYEQRLERDTDEARAERARYERLKASVDTDAYASEAIRDSAQRFYERWLHHSGLEMAQKIAVDIIDYVDVYIVTTAFDSIEDVDGPRELRAAALKQNLPYLVDYAFEFFYITFIDLKAGGIVNHLNPGEMPFEELRTWAGIALLEERFLASAPRGIEPTKLRGLLGLPVDHAAFSFARYFGGQAAPIGKDGNLAQLWVKAPRGQQRYLAISEILPPELLKVVDPESVTPTLERIREERNETKAKVFVGMLALACQQGIDPESFFVSTGELVRLAAGYERTGKSKTNNAYYWAKAADVVTYLMLDLACTNVRVRVKLRHYPEPLVVEEYLMHRPRPVFDVSLPYAQFANRVISLTNLNAKEELRAYIKTANLKGLFLGFPGRVLDAFGARTGKGQPNALEKVSQEVLQLKGPAFWLAYEIAFLRRWALREAVTAQNGKNLLEALESHGYLQESASRTGGRVGCKAALGSWFKDVSALVDINMLAAPGVSVFKLRKGDWHDVTHEVRGWLGARGVRITRDKLAELKVIYHLPRKRRDELVEPKTGRKS